MSLQRTCPGKTRTQPSIGAALQLEDSVDEAAGESITGNEQFERSLQLIPLTRCNVTHLVDLGEKVLSIDRHSARMLTWDLLTSVNVMLPTALRKPNSFTLNLQPLKKKLGITSYC